MCGKSKTTAVQEQQQFKAGDRVRYVGKHPVYHEPELIGELGTVVWQVGPLNVSVKFDNGRNPGVYPQNLELVTEEPKVEPRVFKVGDRVKYVRGGREFTGQEGTIIEVDYNDRLVPYNVRFENRSWWSEETSLELVTAPAEPQVGSKVTVLMSQGAFDALKAKDGTITKVLLEMSWEANAPVYTIDLGQGREVRAYRDQFELKAA